MFLCPLVMQSTQNAVHLAGELALGWQADTLGRQVCAQASPMQAQGSSAMLHCRSGACSEAAPCCSRHRPAGGQASSSTAAACLQKCKLSCDDIRLVAHVVLD